MLSALSRPALQQLCLATKLDRSSLSVRTSAVNGPGFLAVSLWGLLSAVMARAQGRSARRALLGLLLGLIAHAPLARSSDEPQIPDASAGYKSDAELQELYESAIKIRNQTNPSWKEQQKAVDNLLKAAGLRTRLPGISGFPQGQGSEPGIPVPGFPELEFSATRCHKESLRELAKALMDGFGTDRDTQLALELFRHAAELGDPEAQGQMAMRYSLGLQYLSSWDEDGIVIFGQPDEEAAMLNYYFGALGGDSLSRMALAYRHLHGRGVPKSCWTAASYYLPVAEEVANLSSIDGASALPSIERIRLNMQFLQQFKGERHKEMVQFYQDSADKGNVDAQTAVGQVYNYGMHGMRRDHATAMHYLQKAADAGEAQATAHLGHMHANGLAGKVDLEAALEHFQSAAEEGNPSAQYGLGYMYLVGEGVDQDQDKALKLFTSAAEQGHPDAHFYLGIMHLKGLGVRRKSVQRAFSYFTLAAHAGHVLAMYNAAMLHLAGKGTVRNCKPAVALLKVAAEKGPVAAALQLGHEEYFKGQSKQALWHYLQAGEAGMELGMSNAAWLLSKGYVRAEGTAENVTFELFQRSAELGNVASLLSMADAYYYGQGIPQDWARAAAIYYEAYQERSPEAMFNLGFMHEFGAGVPKDLSLALRFYNMALHTSKDAALAVYCARAWLAIHSAWEWVLPHIPAKYRHMVEQIGTLHPPHTSVLGAWARILGSSLPGSQMLRAELGLWQWVDSTGVGQILGWAGQELGNEVGDTALLAALLLLLYLVLRLRRNRAAARRLLGTDEEARQRMIAEQVVEGGMAEAARRRHQHEAQEHQQAQHQTNGAASQAAPQAAAPAEQGSSSRQQSAEEQQRQQEEIEQEQRDPPPAG